MPENEIRVAEVVSGKIQWWRMQFRARLLECSTKANRDPQAEVRLSHVMRSNNSDSRRSDGDPLTSRSRGKKLMQGSRIRLAIYG